ncbi:MAG: hypothetical protein VX294_05645 [Candidatus Latescibacterota bacterium]|nr:hypothetical protein [Candidatus Latescibacterota bacterium]
MIFLFIGRALFYWARLFLFVCIIYSCQSREYEIVYQEPPHEDFEAYGASLHVVRPTEKAEIFASEFREFYKERFAVASGEVGVLLRDLEDAITTKFRCDFMKLDHQDRKWLLNGNVEIQIQHDVSIYSDSLIWDIERNQLKIPGNLLIKHSNGQEKGANFQSDTSAKTFQFSDVDGYWISSDVSDSIHVRAGIAQGHFVEGDLQVLYFDARLRTSGMELFGRKAYWGTQNFLLAFTGGVRGVDGATNFEADKLELNVEKHQLVAEGSVSIRRDSVGLSADGWKEDRRLGSTEIWGSPASYSRELANIQGRRMNYKEQEDLLIVDSTAIFEDSEYYIVAQRMTFDGNQKRLTAKNDVKMRSSDWDGVLIGQNLTLNLLDERGWIDGDPRLIFSEEDFLFRADSIGFGELLNQVVGAGSVLFENRSLQVESDKAILSVNGDQITFYNEVELGGNITENNYSYWMLADTLNVDLIDGKFTQADLGGKFRGRIDVKSGYIGLLLGGDGRVVFSDGNLDEIELSKGADLTYGGGEMGERNRFQGEKMNLFFNKQGLSQLYVDGGAQLFSQPIDATEGGDVNQVFAEEIDVQFKDGRIDNIRIGPSAQGVYITRDEVEK